MTEFLSASFHDRNQTDLLAICADERLCVIEDDYGTYFDGMIVWSGKKFHIHLNTINGNVKDSKRGRYTLAHELGHYFLEAHNHVIRFGEVKPHPSKIALQYDDKMEAEADYFASCLLMPRERLRAFTGSRKPFSLKIIQELSDSFDVSLISALIRFAEVGTHGIMVTFCKSNTVKWYCKSVDFPKLSHRFKVGSSPPPTSVIGESYLKSDAKYNTVQRVDLEDWFYDADGAPKWQMYEQCFYSDVFDFAVSMVWFE